METNRTLSSDKLDDYRKAGLSDDEIALLNTPFANLNPTQCALAFRARDKFDNYYSKGE